MYIRIISLLCIISMFSLSGCGDDDDDAPAVVLKVIDCPNADIVMTPNVTVSGGSRRWSVKVTINVTCNGSPVDRAEIKVKYSWLTVFKIKTDAQGNASVSRVSQQDQRPSGSIDVTIEGLSGSIPQSVTY